VPKIVVVNRVHFEWTGRIVDRIFRESPPIPGVTLVTREVPEWAEGQRGFDCNIAVNWEPDPDGNRDQRFAAYVQRMCTGADLVLDIHGIPVGRDYPAWRLGTPPSPLVAGVASLLNSNEVIAYDSPHLAGMLPNYVLWDLAPNTGVINRLRSYLVRLSEGWKPQVRPMTAFRYVGAVTEIQAETLRLARKYDQFERLPDGVGRALGLIEPIHAFDWDADAYSHVTGFRGELLTPLLGS